MSTPQEIWISRIDGKYTEVFLDKKASATLFEYMVERMYQVAPGYAEQFEYGNWETFAIDDASEQDYMAIYGLILEAADKLEVVKPYRAELKAALEADPRFMAKAA